MVKEYVVMGWKVLCWELSYGEDMIMCGCWLMDKVIKEFCLLCSELGFEVEFVFDVYIKFMFVEVVYFCNVIVD